jgi:hypothetical protein
MTLIEKLAGESWKIFAQKVFSLLKAGLRAGFNCLPTPASLMLLEVSLRP